jgi:SOS-response transcriptional repressor LexA
VVIPTFNEPARAGTSDATAPIAAPHRPDLAGLIAIDPALIHRQFGCRPGDLCHIQVSGHSMSPTLEDGDTVLINTTVDTVATNGIYVLQIGSNLLIKRVQIKLDGSLVISGDNPAYPPETVAPERAQQLAVVGRMVWPRVR